MGVRAKFKCESITEFEHGYKEVKMSAVCSTTGENADYCKYTPSGILTININPETKAVKFFKVGQNYYLDFSEAPNE